MKRERVSPRITVRRAFMMIMTIASLSVIGCVGMMMHRGVEKPAPKEFGNGPRASQEGRFSATLESEGALAPRKMQTVVVTILDLDGRPVEGASLRIDGGMPQHGHGLPSRPRVTRSLGGGRYQVDGVKFNMGGWWELHVDVDSPAGSDRVTFNLEI